MDILTLFQEDLVFAVAVSMSICIAFILVWGLLYGAVLFLFVILGRRPGRLRVDNDLADALLDLHYGHRHYQPIGSALKEPSSSLPIG